MFLQGMFSCPLFTLEINEKSLSSHWNPFPPTVSTVTLKYFQQLKELIKYLHVKDLKEAVLHQAHAVEK